MCLAYLTVDLGSVSDTTCSLEHSQVHGEETLPTPTQTCLSDSTASPEQHLLLGLSTELPGVAPKSPEHHLSLPKEVH